MRMQGPEEEIGAKQSPHKKTGSYSGEINSLSIRVACSKGTYIRVLAQDIGEALDCGGYLTALRRTLIADLDVRRAFGLEDLEKAGPGSASRCCRSICCTAFQHSGWIAREPNASALA